MAQTKKKGPAPKPKTPPKRHKTTTEKVMIVVGILVAASMLFSMIRF
jgi:cell division protein FtsL